MKCTRNEDYLINRMFISSGYRLGWFGVAEKEPVVWSVTRLLFNKAQEGIKVLPESKIASSWSIYRNVVGCRRVLSGVAGEAGEGIGG